MDPVGYELRTTTGGKGEGVYATRCFDIGQTVVVKNGHSAQDLDEVIQEIGMSPEMGAARQEARDLATEAIRELDVLPKGKYRTAMGQLAEFVLERKK